MKESVRRYGFRCKLCGRNARQLYGVNMEFEGKLVQAVSCDKCLRRVGLRESKDSIKKEW